MSMRPLFALILVSLLLLVGCGGGSAGTGTGASIEGRVLESGQPVAGATVTVLETGDSVLTDADGFFSIPTPADAEKLTLEITTGSGSRQVVVPNNSSGSIVNVEIEMDTPSKPLPADDISLKASIVGVCDQYFENRNPIRQANAIPAGIICTAKAEISSNAKPLGGVRFAIQHRRCNQGSPWVTDALGETSEKFFPGIGQIQFKFFDDSEHCRYRFIAPFMQEGPAQKTVEILSFSAQGE